MRKSDLVDVCCWEIMENSLLVLVVVLFITHLIVNNIIYKYYYLFI